MAVYFVQAGEGGPVKIGFSADVGVRISALRTACPAELRALAFIDGGPETERDLHRRFHGHRLTGEWFRPCTELMSVIASATAIRVPSKSLASELIDAFGGNREMAKIAGVLTTAVSNWRKLGRIPPRLYLRIAAAGRERGVPVPEVVFQATSDEERRAAPEAA